MLTKDAKLVARLKLSLLPEFNTALRYVFEVDWITAFVICFSMLKKSTERNCKCKQRRKNELC